MEGMLRGLKKTISHHLLNFLGWKTNRKIVVIESDDWGSVRMPSLQAYKALLKAGLPIDNDPYCRYDSLASEQDLSSLFEVLSSVKDSKGSPAKITANCVLVNPDFDKIKESDFQEYKYELFTKTLNRYPHHCKSFNLWEQGMQEQVFHPQFHGREHLNVAMWMKVLQVGDPDMRLAFQWKTFGVNSRYIQNQRNNCMAAFDATTNSELKNIDFIITEGLNLFKKIFSYNSLSVIAPCYIWHSDSEKILAKNGVKLLQGIPFQYLPHKRYKKIYHYTGQKNKHSQYYLVRNAFFEPSLDRKINWVNECLRRIQISFNCKKPAIIGSHRLNYISSVDRNNNNLFILQDLLNRIVKLWPEVEFLTSEDLLAMMIPTDKIKN